MKKLLFCFLFSVFCFLASAQPAMKLAHLEHDFSKISAKGKPVAHAFTFKNTGDKPLVILQVETSCNCAFAAYPKRPIAPGACGEITITYDPKGQKGPFFKAIQILTNEPAKRRIISVQGEVVK